MSLERQMRRKAQQRLAQWAKSLPQISAGEAFNPGVTFACFSHDDHCQTLRSGNGADCNCDPDITYHRDH